MTMYPYSYNEVRNKERRLHVNGLGRLSVQPDIATIHIGVISENEEIQIAEKENTQATESFLSALKQAGINEKQIQTTHFNVQPIYHQQDDSSQISGYQVTNEVRVTVSQLNQIGTIIALAMEHGANQINSLEFGLTEKQKWYYKALNEALVDAISKAQSIANVLNVTVDLTPIKITEDSRQIQPFTQKFALQSIASPPIEPGEIIVEAIITAVFRYS
ncbi:SIMPL domain-containing protein [Cytobacillus sp. OWB-43]|uniref:SIMPL domain-containing protein n=1 Tax=Cytobacillus sp. OWB-43 TaxID=3108468 RepID=UPI002AFE91DD|nr:SIMPL domain-containing protein [Cytobacillus sp. OWB-43]MEA1854092.1 SIMPL domain-containing protein [Cytobacillus sp. OWB-43]